jgi:hypothetical protein
MCDNYAPTTNHYGTPCSCGGEVGKVPTLGHTEMPLSVGHLSLIESLLAESCILPAGTRLPRRAHRAVSPQGAGGTAAQIVVGVRC